MAHPLLEDSFVAAQVDDAVGPWAERLPADEVSWLRDQLAMLLQTDPEAAALLAGAHPRGVDARGMDASGERGAIGLDEKERETTPDADHG